MKKDIIITPIPARNGKWQCRYCFSYVDFGQRVCHTCGCGIGWGPVCNNEYVGKHEKKYIKEQQDG